MVREVTRGEDLRHGGQDSDHRLQASELHPHLYSYLIVKAALKKIPTQYYTIFNSNTSLLTTYSV